MTQRIAVIGAGLMGADHAAIVAQDLPGAVLQVVCDRDQGRARTVADAHGAADVASDPAAVIVASPDFTHAPLMPPPSSRKPGRGPWPRARN